MKSCVEFFFKNDEILDHPGISVVTLQIIFLDISKRIQSEQIRSRFVPSCLSKR